MEVHKNKNGGIMVKKVILYLLTMIFALSTATALAAEPADAPVSMRESCLLYTSDAADE